MINEFENLEDYQQKYIVSLTKLLSVKRHYGINERELLDFILRTFFDLKIVVSPKRKLFRLTSCLK